MNLVTTAAEIGKAVSHMKVFHLILKKKLDLFFNILLVDFFNSPEYLIMVKVCGGKEGKTAIGLIGNVRKADMAFFTTLIHFLKILLFLTKFLSFLLESSNHLLLPFVENLLPIYFDINLLFLLLFFKEIL